MTETTEAADAPVAITPDELDELVAQEEAAAAEWETLEAPPADDPEGEDETLPETVDPVVPEYTEITAKELQAWLELKAVATNGSKKELYARLEAYYAGEDVPEFEHPEEPEVDPEATPEFYTVQDETSYIEIAAKFGFDNYRELGGLNGVFNSRYEVVKGQKVRLTLAGTE